MIASKPWYPLLQLLIAFVAAPSLALAQDEVENTTEETLLVETGRTISIEYTLKLTDGSVADSNVGGEGLTYEQGASQILPALENALVGMKIDDMKHVDLTAEDGYGIVREELYQSVEPSMIPEESRNVGAVLVGEDAMGNQRQVRVHEVHEDTIVLDFNHPLAGQSLSFDIKILAIN